MSKPNPKTPKNPKMQYQNREEMMAAIEKRFGKGAVTIAGAGPILDIEVISTGAMALDAALGVGGIPLGRVCEIYGPEMSGKTTLALSIIKQCQQKGMTAAFIDAEHALDLAWAKNIGVDINELMISQPDSGEQALEICEMMVLSRVVNLIVIDSVAALTPQVEIDGEMSDVNIGAQAKLMSKAMRKLSAIASKSKCAIVFINQIRDKIGIMYGSPETTPGGKALKFYASVRLDIRRKGAIKEGDVHVGNEVIVKVVKNKVAPPFRVGEFSIYFGTEGYPSGVDYYGSLLSAAIDVDIISSKSGGYHTYGDVKLGQGRKAVQDFLRDCPDVAKEIEDKVKKIYSEKVAVIKHESELEDEGDE